MGKYDGYKPADFDEYNQDASKRFWTPILIGIVVVPVALALLGIAISILSGIPLGAI